MTNAKSLSLFIVTALFLTGCLSPRLGYPVKTVEVPTPVTLFSTIAAKPEIYKMNMDFLSREAWGILYDKKFQEILDKVSVQKLQYQVNEIFQDRAEKASDLFALSSREVLNTDIQFSKTKEDPPEYSGFDFSASRDSIPTKYILALTIDDWGYSPSRKIELNGPFMVITIQLIDKETNASLWRYSLRHQENISQEAYELTQASYFEEAYQKMITNAVSRYFQWLNSK